MRNQCLFRSEAQASLDKAYELMARHNLSVEQVNSVHKGYVEEEVYTHTENAILLVIHSISHIMENYFNCRVVQASGEEQKRILLVGKPDKMDSAGMIFNFLLITFPKLYQKYLDSEAALPSNSFFSF